jgi:hypothetical protein
VKLYAGEKIISDKPRIVVQLDQVPEFCNQRRAKCNQCKYEDGYDIEDYDLLGQKHLQELLRAHNHTSCPKDRFGKVVRVETLRKILKDHKIYAHQQ